jgi:hypothetical protein
MNELNRKEMLEALFDATLRDLLKLIESGEAKPADRAVARQMLNDNGIQCLPQANKDLAGLMSILPEFADNGLTKPDRPI